LYLHEKGVLTSETLDIADNIYYSSNTMLAYKDHIYVTDYRKIMIFNNKCEPVKIINEECKVIKIHSDKIFTVQCHSRNVCIFNLFGELEKKIRVPEIIYYIYVKSCEKNIYVLTECENIYIYSYDGVCIGIHNFRNFDMYIKITRFFVVDSTIYIYYAPPVNKRNDIYEYDYNDIIKKNMCTMPYEYCSLHDHNNTLYTINKNGIIHIYDIIKKKLL